MQPAAKPPGPAWAQDADPSRLHAASTVLGQERCQGSRSHGRTWGGITPPHLPEQHCPALGMGHRNITGRERRLLSEHEADQHHVETTWQYLTVTFPSTQPPLPLIHIAISSNSCDTEEIKPLVNSDVPRHNQTISSQTSAEGEDNPGYWGVSLQVSKGPDWDGKDNTLLAIQARRGRNLSQCESKTKINTVSKIKQLQHNKTPQ